MFFDGFLGSFLYSSAGCGRSISILLLPQARGSLGGVFARVGDGNAGTYCLQGRFGRSLRRMRRSSLHRVMSALFLELLLLFAFRASPFDCSVCGSQALLFLVLPSRAILTYRQRRKATSALLDRLLVAISRAGSTSHCHTDGRGELLSEETGHCEGCVEWDCV